MFAGTASTWPRTCRGARALFTTRRGRRVRRAVRVAATSATRWRPSGDTPRPSRRTAPVLAQAAGVPDAFAQGRQVHGAGVAARPTDRRAADGRRRRPPPARTSRAIVLAADCLPVALAGAAAAVAMVHAGWRGLAGGVAARAALRCARSARGPVARRDRAGRRRVLLRGRRRGARGVRRLGAPRAAARSTSRRSPRARLHAAGRRRGRTTRALHDLREPRAVLLPPARRRRTGRQAGVAWRS